MRRVNLPTAEIPAAEHPEGYRRERLKVAPLIGAATMTGSYDVLAPGPANCQYHLWSAATARSTTTTERCRPCAT